MTGFWRAWPHCHQWRMLTCWLAGVTSVPFTVGFWVDWAQTRKGDKS